MAYEPTTIMRRRDIDGNDNVSSVVSVMQLRTTGRQDVVKTHLILWYLTHLNEFRQRKAQVGFCLSLRKRQKDEEEGGLCGGSIFPDTTHHVSASLKS